MPRVVNPDSERTDEPYWSEFWHRLADDGRTDPVLAAASAQGFVLAASEVAALGVTRAQARTRVRRDEWTAAGHGFLAPVHAPTDRHRHVLAAAAAVHRRPQDAISGRSAAIVHALPTMGLPPRPQLTLRAESLGRGSSSAAHCRIGWLPSHEITTWYGAAVTTVERTLVDLARHDRFDAIMATDAALHHGLTTPADIVTGLGTAIGWPGVRQAREVLALADARAESPLESVTRLRLHDDGFPPPELQFSIGGYWVDLCWPDLKLVLEVDGRVKYRTPRPGEPDPLWRGEEARDRDPPGRVPRRACDRVGRLPKLAADLGLPTPVLSAPTASWLINRPVDQPSRRRRRERGMGEAGRTDQASPPAVLPVPAAATESSW